MAKTAHQHEVHVVSTQAVVGAVTSSNWRDGLPSLCHGQVVLRELRASDLNGSAGLFRLKEELTRRVNNAVAPVKVSAVLFKEIMVQ